MLCQGGLIVVAVALIALVAGMFLLMEAWEEERCCALFSKIVGYVVVVLSVLLMVGGAWHAFSDGTCSRYGESGWGKMHEKGMRHYRMKKMRMHRDMINPMGDREIMPSVDEDEGDDD